MPIGKILLSDTEKVYTPSENYHLEYSSNAFTELQISSIEIFNLESPSDLVMKIYDGELNMRVKNANEIPLLRYRCKFLHQKERFILDTSTLREFKIMNPFAFKIEVESESQMFSILMYFEAPFRRKSVDFNRRVLRNA